LADVEWIENIKRIVIQAMEAGDPCDVIPGTVVRENPVEIQLSDKIVLFQSQILVPEQLKDHNRIMNIPGLGEVTVEVKGEVKMGKRVLLLQKRGGQQYVVIGTW
jgi:hypothetical protein